MICVPLRPAASSSRRASQASAARSPESIRIAFSRPPVSRLRGDRPAHALERVVGVDEQRRAGGPRAQPVGEDVELAGRPARHDLGVRHRPRGRDAEVAGGGGRRRPGEAGEVGRPGRAVAGAEAVEAAQREVPHRPARRGAHDLRRVRRDADGVVHRRQQRRLDERRLQARRREAQQRRRGRHDRPLADRPHRAAEAQVARGAASTGASNVTGSCAASQARSASVKRMPSRKASASSHAGDGHRAGTARRQLERDEVVRRALVDVVGRHRQAIQIGEQGVAAAVMGGSTRTHYRKSTTVTNGASRVHRTVPARSVVAKHHRGCEVGGMAASPPGAR